MRIDGVSDRRDPLSGADVACSFINRTLTLYLITHISSVCQKRSCRKKYFSRRWRHARRALAASFRTHAVRLEALADCRWAAPATIVLTGTPNPFIPCNVRLFYEVQKFARPSAGNRSAPSRSQRSLACLCVNSFVYVFKLRAVPIFIRYKKYYLTLKKCSSRRIIKNMFIASYIKSSSYKSVSYIKICPPHLLIYILNIC